MILSSQFLVCLLNFLEAHFCKRFKFVAQVLQFIRMVFVRKFPVGVLYLNRGRISVNPQNPVCIPKSVTFGMLTVCPLTLLTGVTIAAAIFKAAAVLLIKAAVIRILFLAGCQISPQQYPDDQIIQPAPDRY